jgi:hypothetical protein
MAAVDRRAVGGGHVDSIDKVFDRDWDAVQRPARRFGIALPGGGEDRLPIEILPGADDSFARLDPVEIGGRQSLGGQPALGDLPGRLPNGQRAKVGHRGLLCAAWAA